MPDQTTGSLTDVCLRNSLGLNIDPRSSLLQNSWPQYQVNQWNFRKADWNHFSLLTNEAMQSLTSSTTTNIKEDYQVFCSAVIKAAKRSIPCSRKKNYILCWDKKCENLYCAFLDAPNREKSSSATTALLSYLDKLRCDRWNEAIDSIGFSHSQPLSIEYPQQANR